MKHLRAYGLVGALCWLVAGCQKEVEVASSVSAPESEQTVAPVVQPAVAPVPVPTPIEAEVKASADEDQRSFVILCEPWSQYFRSRPTLYAVASLSSGMRDLLSEEQGLIKQVLDASGDVEQSSDYAALEDQLDELKTMIPSAETASGYVPTTRRTYGSYAYVVGDTYYASNGRYYYYDSYRYRVLREKQASSSPDLVRSVQNLVHNATLELKDLDQRIEALKTLKVQWDRRTSEMSMSGTSGIMREANEAYLTSLADFSREFIRFRSQVREVYDAQISIETNRARILSEWSTFEGKRLGILKSYIESNALARVDLNAGNELTLDVNFMNRELILACEIGDRVLYFEVSNRKSKLHPFVMVEVTPQI